jgi:hypothetical protein
VNGEREKKSLRKRKVPDEIFKLKLNLFAEKSLKSWGEGGRRKMIKLNGKLLEESKQFHEY